MESLLVLLATSPSRAIAILRITLRVIFFAHGAQKVLGWFGGCGLTGTIDYLTSTGIPRPVAYAVCFFEFFGGIGLVLGLLTRPAALAVVVVMVGAIAKGHWQKGLFLNWELKPGKGHGFEANLAFIAMGLACAISGGGALSIDRLLVG